MGSFVVIFGRFGTVGTFGTPDVFGTLKIASVFNTLGIIPSEFLVHLVHFGTLDVWYTSWYTTPVGAVSVFLVHSDHYWSFLVRLVLYLRLVHQLRLVH